MLTFISRCHLFLRKIISCTCLLFSLIWGTEWLPKKIMEKTEVHCGNGSILKLYAKWTWLSVFLFLGRSVGWSTHYAGGSFWLYVGHWLVLFNHSIIFRHMKVDMMSGHADFEPGSWASPNGRVGCCTGMLVAARNGHEKSSLWANLELVLLLVIYSNYIQLNHIRIRDFGYYYVLLIT